jgi:hypothetical protein
MVSSFRGSNKEEPRKAGYSLFDIYNFSPVNSIRTFILKYLSLNLNQEALALDLLLSLFY